MRVILCAYNWIGCKAIELCREKGFEIFVYTHKNPPHINSVVDYCTKQNIPYSTKKISILNLPFVPDIIASIYYRYLIPENLIELVKNRIFNLHPSLLPRYKGCSSLTWAMINGEKYVGYTYHYLTSNIDSGNIILQKTVEIEDWDTQITLYHRLMFKAADDFLEALDKVQIGYNGVEQNGNETYFNRGCPFEGRIDKSWDDSKIERFIRAMNYPPLPYATLDGIEIKTFFDYQKVVDGNGNPF